MSREIKFRGKGIDNGEWVYGSFIQESLRWGSKFSILVMANDEESDDIKQEVYHPTVGQFTGLKDKNGKEIYEGDILKSLSHVFVCEWMGAGWKFNSITRKNATWSTSSCNSMRIIGNIHENPELL